MWLNTQGLHPDAHMTSTCVVYRLTNEIGPPNVKIITVDNGSEFSSMVKRSGIDIYFAHAYSSFERGSNENFNGLLREYMPKGKSFNE